MSRLNESILRNQVIDSLSYGAELRLKVAEKCTQDILAAASAIVEALDAGGKLQLCGNGGSAADAQHIAAELVSRFVREREPWPAIALTTDTSALTAIDNSCCFAPPPPYIQPTESH